MDFPCKCLGTLSTECDFFFYLCVFGKENMCLYLPLQAVHGAAAFNGVGARVRGSHRAQTQLLCGQRWCSAGCQTAAAWSGLWAPPAPVWLRASVCSPRGCRACVHSQPLHLHIQKHQQAHTCEVTRKDMIKEKKNAYFLIHSPSLC